MCWINCKDGQLGNGFMNANKEPNKVKLPYKMDFVSCGLNHCVVVNSFSKKVYGWGSNHFKQLSPFLHEETIKKPIELSLVYHSGDFTSKDLYI
jgi:alpha-tubulin suppressor-like RCC1 family protein